MKKWKKKKKKKERKKKWQFRVHQSCLTLKLTGHHIWLRFILLSRAASDMFTTGRRCGLCCAPPL
jgi:hypothetical protein